MPEAIQPNTTPEQFFWQGYLEALAAFSGEPESVAEVKRAEIGDHAERLSHEVWAKPAQSWSDVVLRAHITVYWTGVDVDENGVPMLPDLESPNMNERAVAELIAAVLAYVRNQEGGQ